MLCAHKRIRYFLTTYSLKKKYSEIFSLNETSCIVKKFQLSSFLLYVLSQEKFLASNK